MLPFIQATNKEIKSFYTAYRVCRFSTGSQGRGNARESVLFLSGEYDGKGCSGPGFTFYLDIPAMVLNESVTHG